MFSGMVDIGLSFARNPGRSGGVPGCLLSKLGGHYHAAKYTFLAVMPQGS